MVYVAIAAGGIGLRMGTDIPKQFIEICGKPILVHTIERFLSNKNIKMLLIGINPEWVDYTAEIMDKFFPENNRIRVVCGGENRNETVKNIIDNIDISFGLTPEDIIITHDAVRPFVSDEIICRNIEYAMESGACGTYLPAVDTIAVSECGSFIKEIPNRQHMYQVQTPQSFNLILLKNCFESLGCKTAEYTDTCSICAAMGVKIRMVFGEPKNIKITTPFDLVIARAILEGEG